MAFVGRPGALTPHPEGPDAYDTWMGGRPKLPGGIQVAPTCGVCGAPLALVMQTNVPSQSHSSRFVLVFGCIAKDCGASSRAWKALRVVLTKPVAEAEEAVGGADPQASAPAKRAQHRPAQPAAPSSPRGASGRRLPPPRATTQVRSLEASQLAWGGGRPSALSSGSASGSGSDSDSDGSFDFDDMDAALAAAEGGGAKDGAGGKLRKAQSERAGGTGAEDDGNGSAERAKAETAEVQAGETAGASGAAVDADATGLDAAGGAAPPGLDAVGGAIAPSAPSAAAPHLVGFYLYAEPDRMARARPGAPSAAAQVASSSSPSLPPPVSSASSDDEPEAWQGEAWEPDAVLTGAADAAFLRFSRALATCPDACARHGGDVELWPAEESAAAPADGHPPAPSAGQGAAKGAGRGGAAPAPPPQASSGGVIVDPPSAAWPPACPRCGGERRYECQLLAPAIAALEEAAGWVGKPGPPLAWDWLAVSVATCARDCVEPSKDDLESAQRGYLVADEALRMAREVFHVQKRG